MNNSRTHELEMLFSEGVEKQILTYLEWIHYYLKLGRKLRKTCDQDHLEGQMTDYIPMATPFTKKSENSDPSLYQ